MSCVAVLEGHTLQRVQCRRLALRLPGPCARATGAASPWETVGVPHLAHISLSPSTWRLQPPLCHGVSGQRGTGGLLGAPCAARSRAGTPGAPAVLALPACGSRGGSGAAPCPVGSAPTLCWRPPRPPALPQWGVCRRPRGTNGHIVGGSRGQPRGPPHPGLSVPKAVSLLDGESTLPPRSPCSPERGRDPLAGEKPPDVPSVPPSRPRRWSLGLGGGEGAAAPRGPASGSHTGGGAGSADAARGPPDPSRWGYVSARALGEHSSAYSTHCAPAFRGTPAAPSHRRSVSRAVPSLRGPRAGRARAGAALSHPGPAPGGRSMGATWPAAPAEPQLPLGQTDSGTGRGQPWDRRALVSPPGPHTGAPAAWPERPHVPGGNGTSVFSQGQSGSW